MSIRPIALLMVLALVVAACGRGAADNPTTAPEATTTTAPEATTTEAPTEATTPDALPLSYT
ncbi:MAG: hypothetical protein V3W06_07455, partial [Acidimicrobiia bacterium]